MQVFSGLQDMFRIMAWFGLEGIRKDRLVHPPCLSRDIFNQVRLLRAPSNLTLNMSNDGATDSFSGQPREKQPSWKAAVRPPWSLSSPGRTVTASQPFFIRDVFRPSDYFCGFFWTQVDVCLVQGNPRTGHGALSGVSQKQRSGWELSPQLATHTSFDAARDTVDFLACRHTLPAPVQFLLYQNPKVILCSLFSIHSPCNLCWYWGLPQPRCRVLDLALLNLVLHKSRMAAFLRLVQVPVDGITSLQQNQLLSLVSPAGVPRMHFVRLSTLKTLSSTGPSMDFRGIWFPLGCWAIDCNSLHAASSLPHRTVHLSNPYLSNLVARVLGTPYKRPYRNPAFNLISWPKLQLSTSKMCLENSNQLS